ncbi:hypothetical protein, partial [Tetzosporium hominis]|uniref:hypothetical protein n=1 Tax=Tetzosporium hominis TaxID=2020506 RepID=UPI001A9CA2A5
TTGPDFLFASLAADANDSSAWSSSVRNPCMSETCTDFVFTGSDFFQWSATNCRISKKAGVTHVSTSRSYYGKQIGLGYDVP